MTDALIDSAPQQASGSRPASIASSVEEGGLFDDLAFLEQATAAPSKQKQKSSGGGGWFGRQKAKNAAQQSRTQATAHSKSKAPPQRAHTYPESPELEEGMSVFQDLAVLSRRAETPNQQAPSTPKRKLGGGKFNMPTMGSLSRRGGKSLARSNTSSSAQSSSTITSFSTMPSSQAIMRHPSPKSGRPLTMNSGYSAYTDYTASIADAEPREKDIPPVPSVPSLPPTPSITTPSVPVTPVTPQTPASPQTPAQELLSAPPRKNSLGPGSSPILTSKVLDEPTPMLPQEFAWAARRPSGQTSEIIPSRQTSSNGESRSTRLPSDAGTFGRRPSSPGLDRRRSGAAVDWRRPSGVQSEGTESRRGSSTLVGTLGMAGARKLSHPLTAIQSHRGSVAESTASPRFTAMVDDFPRPPSVFLPPSMTPFSRSGSHSPKRRPSEPAPQLEPSLPESPLLSSSDMLPIPPLFDIRTDTSDRHISTGASSVDTYTTVTTPATPSSPEFQHRVVPVVLPIDDDLSHMLRSANLNPMTQVTKIPEHARPESVMLPDLEFPGIEAVESPSEVTAEQVVADYLSRTPRTRTTSQPEPSRSRSGSGSAAGKLTAANETGLPLPARPRRRSSAPHRCPTPTGPTGHRSRPSLPDSPPPPVPSHPHVRAASVPFAGYGRGK